MERITNLTQEAIVDQFKELKFAEQFHLLTALLKVFADSNDMFNLEHYERAIAEYAQAGRSNVLDITQEERPNPADRSRGF